MLEASATALLRKAHAAAKGTTWLRELSPLPPEDVVLEPVDESAVAAIAASPARALSAAKWARLTADLERGLAETDHVPFEQALNALGSLLGAKAWKPTGKGRADSVRDFGGLLWITLEAKSEETPGAPVSMDDIRQANTHLRILAADKGAAIPPGSLSVIISPRQLTDPDAAAIAESHLFFCAPGSWQAWRRVLSRRGEYFEPRP